MNIVSDTGWGPYTIIWGDGSPNTVGGFYTPNSLISHTYNSASPDTFEIQLIIPSTCTVTGVAVMEKPVNASIQIPIGGVTTACAPKALQFTNSSTDVSETTWFTWNFGDGSPAETYSYTNAGQTITHTYNKNTVNCQTAVTLTAKNYCTPIPTIANFNPIQIYDVDDAAITPSAFIKCWPDNVFTFTNSTNRNCVPQGNTFQRQEKWNLGDYWGYGHDSIINWRPWPPSTPLTVAYPSVGTYTAQLMDSNLCGVDIQVQSVTIVNPPTAGLIAPPGPFCQGASVTFTNTSATGYSYKWNFGTGGGFVTKPFGPQSNTYNSPGTFTVSVVALIGGAGAACTDTEKVVITILPRPTANFTVSPNKGCDQITGAVFTDGSSSAVAWDWNFGNGNTFNGQVPPAQNYTNTGTAVASLTVTAANTCVHTFTAPITVYQTPVAAFSPSSACVGSPAFFIDNTTHAPGDPVVAWHWDFGDASPTATATTQNPAHTYSLQNTYTVQLIANTANCSDTISQTITINIKPTAGFTLTPVSGCPTLTVNFTNTSSNATSYNWNFGNGNNSTLSDPSEAFTNTLSVNKTYTVTLTASTGVGCSDTQTATVVVFSKPTASFTVNAPAGCSPVAATFTNNSTGATAYNWNFGDANTSTVTASVLSHTYLNTTLLIQTFTAQLVAISSNGCKDSTTLTVTIYPRPIFNFTMVPNSGCSPLNINFPPVLGAVNYQWNFGDGSPLSFSPNPNHTFTNTTTSDQTFTVQLIASNAFSCVDTTYGYPVVYAKPAANFALTPTVGCSPLPVTFTNTTISGSTYLWRFGDGNTASTTNTSHTYTNTSSTVDQNFTATLVATSANGCKDSISKTTLVYFKPNASFTLDTPKCVSKTITFTNNSQGNNTNSWNFGDASGTSSVVSPAHTYTNNTSSNTNYTVQLIVTSLNACKDTALGYPVVYAKPVADFAVTPTVGCSPLATAMTNSCSFASSYVWKFGDGNTAATTNATHTYTNASSTTDQTFSCTVVATNPNGCQDSITKNILVYFKPDASFSPDTPKCVSKTITFTNNSQGNNTNSWNFGDGSPLSSVVAPAHTYTNNTSGNTNYTVQLIVTSVNLCKDTALGYPVVYAKPIANFAVTPTVGCSPLTSTMTNSSSFASTYLWKFGDGNTSPSTNPSHTYVNSTYTVNQTYSCTVVAINPNGCVDSLTKNVLVYFKPLAAFALDTPKCKSTTITFTNNSLGGSLYSWNFGDGSPLFPVASPAHVYTNTTTGNVNHAIEMIVTSVNGCKDTANASTTVYAIPDISYTITPTVGCSPLMSVMTNSTVSATSYIWKFGDGATDLSTNTNHTYVNPSNTSDRTYSCTLVASNPNGCIDSLVKPVTVYFKPKSNFTVDTPSCSPKLLTFTNTSIGGMSYNWDLGLSTSTNTDVTIAYTNTTTATITQTVQLITTSVNNCKDTLLEPVYVHPKPEFTIIASPDSGCTALSVNFPLINGVNTYQWSFGDGNASMNANPTNLFYNTSPADKTYTVQLIGIDGYGCRDTSFKVIKVFAKPIALFLANPNTVYVPSTPLTCSNLSSGAISYYWDFGDNTSSTETNPSHTYIDAGEYQIYLVATNAHECKDTFNLPGKIIATLESEVDIPNAFTPNPNGGNGGTYSATDTNNDVFHPVIRGIDKYELNIFSRWGELLFVSHDTAIGWDGYYKGKLCTQDVYVWKITATTLDGKAINKTGDVLLLR
jgi:gliding motility-associated-like protein